LRVRLGEKHIGLLGIDSNDQAALTADRDRHLAADDEHEASEHPLLAHIGLAGEQLANPIGEILVVWHAEIIRLPNDGHAVAASAPPAGTGTAQSGCFNPRTRERSAASQTRCPGCRSDLPR
jgi:hypothetical protein